MRERLFSLISKYHLKANSDLGQNFLVVPDIIERNVERAELGEKDSVLEVGPGLGVLTDALSRRAGKVYAIEKDRRLVEILRAEYDWPNVEIIEGDALKVDFPRFNKIVSNLPYQISSPITFRFLRHEFDRAVLIYQLEFARRMVAEPGDKNYSRLSLMVRAKAYAELVERIGRGAFWPRPKVDSAVIVLEPRPRDERIELNEDLVRALFQHRRSTVLAALKKSHHMLGLSKEEFKRVRGLLEAVPHAGKRVFQLTPLEVRDIEEFLSAEGVLG
ncbi:16S rRNA (adenine(1518)-N(6)/adenine(1519)-N(6))-dimethyltransferase RsmA [Thermococcus sp. JdF3]|uniref:16S rRNA (adenine(1518)-N(6)/adenine(1519)-N(6))- dimethyltransferase RsmA n=1 Tax=Thermococcus sp. JdF3 TaxID=1638258 RepID=UPI00143B9788|nr:16S rRNA (adenine(1518)-N(6)/adenine(1519)-N(6))-dimethyltransferase RsmA [Thermococcus sp. JdF3]NJE01224.1 16S ribosomal RNA methyltransferase A [Thermococcus sp. JdF3]